MRSNGWASPRPPDEASASVLFADLSNSSELFRDLATEQVIELFNEYYDRLGSIALRFGGTIDKALGDGFMARFNVPRRLTDFPMAAVRSALEMQVEFNQIKTEWLRVGRPVKNIANRIGVASGPVIGSMAGHPQHLAYTVIGPAVNVASYLCDAARQTESGIVICPETREAVGDMLRGVAAFVGLESSAEEARYEVRLLAKR
jgi:adenylate cyclase